MMIWWWNSEWSVIMNILGWIGAVLVIWLAAVCTLEWYKMIKKFIVTRKRT